jgi:2,6-dihydroxypyridine 3-monooxygenase
MRVAVMGGSLGGVTAALVLADRGCDVQVFERSHTPLEGRGAGIVLHPATIRYLVDKHALDLDRVSTHANWVRYIDRSGATILEQECRYRFTSYYTLHDGLLRWLDPHRYHLGCEVVAFEERGDEEALKLSSGHVEKCDLLVCADGAHSHARSILLPEVSSSYSGYVGWRGTVGREDLPLPIYDRLKDALTYYVGPRTHILTYPIPEVDGQVRAEHPRINFVWYLNVDPGPVLEGLLTDRAGVRRSISVPPGELREEHVLALRDTAETILPPSLAATVVNSDKPFVQVVFDVEVPRMAFGRVCLIGDSAFTIRPHAAAGTAKAAEDAWQLAAAIATSGDNVLKALSVWERAQLALGRQVLDRARRIGTRSQFEGTYRPGDPDLAFGLYEPGDSWMEA